MGSVEDALATQVRNIETRYGKPMAAWLRIVAKTKEQKHTAIVAMLKSEHGMTHGDAHRIAIIARSAVAPHGEAPNAVASAEALYAGGREALLPIHARVMKLVLGFGDDVELAMKKGYVSLRRKKQFAMLRPAAKHVDVGLVLKGVAVGPRLESAATFNALFTHRLRVATVKEVDREVATWLRAAYDGAA